MTVIDIIKVTRDLEFYQQSPMETLLTYEYTGGSERTTDRTEITEEVARMSLI
jgi:hypothetical protein